MDADPQIADAHATAGRLKSPPVRYLLAYVDDHAVGYCQAWHGLEACGQVEDLFVDPAARHRGAATALLHAAVEAARAGGAGPVVIVADPTDTPRSMYTALGWQPVALMRQWGKNRTAAVAPVRPETEQSDGG
jgi:GNAT superfamily N-acetyltransferase